MAKNPDFKVGGLVRWNRRIGRIQRITAKRVHLRVLMDTEFRVFESKMIDRQDASRLLRTVPSGFYSSVLFKTPGKIRTLCRENALEVMRLILSEYTSPFGKREFKQILVWDDGAVPEERWNVFWNGVYRLMRASDDFTVDEKGRYSLA